jgi:hypothetical protein
MGLSNSPMCRRCGKEDETSARIQCECEALATLRQANLGSFFLDPEDIKNINLGAIWNFSKGTRLPWIDMGDKGPVNWGLGASGQQGLEPKCKSINQCGRQLTTFERNASRQFLELKVSQILTWVVDTSVVVNGHGGNKSEGQIASKVLRTVTGWKMPRQMQVTYWPMFVTQ